MITEDYVSFETAQLLKEKGFNEECFALYNPDGMLIQSGIRLNNIQVGRVKGSYSAPTLQMAMKWLREIYGIDIVIDVSDPSVKDRKYYCMIWGENNKSYILDLFNSYQEACEEAIKYCLEKLI